ncbi:MAG: ATPase [Pseudomonadota bacterium]|jgi:uncharacterized protein YndB with AHSA1/START domain
MRIAVLAAIAALSVSGAANAAVVERGDGWVRMKTVQQIEAPPAKVYAALGEVGRWWDDDHTYSGKAANMSMALQADACWCETIPGGGSVRHGVVELAWPEQGMLRVSAALGPLQDEGVTGALFFHLKPKDGGTEVTITYNVGGARDFVTKGAEGVDMVLNVQWERLKRYVETGKPTP